MNDLDRDGKSAAASPNRGSDGKRGGGGQSAQSSEPGTAGAAEDSFDEGGSRPNVSVDTGEDKRDDGDHKQRKSVSSRAT